MKSYLHEEDIESIRQAKPDRKHRVLLVSTNELGEITAIRADKGYGFCRTPACEEDVFFHETACLDDCYGDLEVGNQIRFRLTKTDKGFRALDVEKV